MSLTSQYPSMVDKPVNESTAIEGDTPPIVHDLTYAQVMFAAAAIGLIGGLVATAYYYLLEGSLHFVWQQVPEKLAAYFPAEFWVNHYVWIAATIGGLLVGLTPAKKYIR